ncbi:hypothetical protein [Vallitalea okinawensis]|uniref:hypothetical protein n=1 Tax=Vallitalea okinawensis TaxID=2078660 RepID=UPI000CFC5A9C|nr:hypothetical protein [Vallitalea okinawensis]
MNKLRNNLYTVVLMLLIFTSVYQTGRLWFDGISNYNPFSRDVIFGTFNTVSYASKGNDSTYNITQPQEMIVYLSSTDPSFAVIENSGGDYKTLYTKSLEILKSFTSTEQQILDVDYDAFWEGVQGSLIFKYDYVVSNDIYNKEVDIDNKIDISLIGGIDTIVIELIKTANQDVHVYLINSENKQMIQLTQTIDSALFNELYKIEDKVIYDEYFDTKVNIEFAYLSTEKTNKKQFEGQNLFLRVPRSISSYYLKDSQFIDIIKPFVAKNKVDNDEFSEYAQSFFNHLPQHTKDENEQYYLYWDSSASIKYNIDGLLEYNRTIDSDVKLQEISKAYDVAMDFMKQYSKWKEFYLVNYEIGLAEEVTFYFEYRLDDYPLLIEGLDQIGLTYPAQVTVSGNQVENAKMYMIQLGVNGSNKNISSKDYYNDVLDREAVKDHIEDIYIAYVTEVGEENIEMNWIIELTGSEENIKVPIELEE